MNTEESINYIELDQKFSEFLFSYSTSNGNKYPDFYGGNRYDEKEGYTFFLNDMKEIDKIKATILKLIPDSKFQMVSYTYQELLDYYTYLNEQKDFDSDFIGYYVDDERGAVVICTRKDPEESQRKFSQLYAPFKRLIFEETSDIVEETKVGENVVANGRISTIGFPARQRGTQNIGFVTTQHGNTNNGVQFYSNGNPNIVIGIQETSMYDGNTDACFVVNVGNNTVQRTSIHSDYLRIIGHAHPQCLKVPVAKHGQIGGYARGRIISLNFTDIINNIDDQYYCSYDSRPGDSGGAVTCFGFVLGIHRAAHTNREGQHRTCVCKYNNIAEDLNIELY